ncbi:MAG TPA: SRPBCC domain-containing protein [Caulobacteraceae bacterium]|jgi:uncharacterized protein YndB with AHSA1/START domain|nr:SRPBCC domain-containing protein [Caulobacteraceae bacterium]
MTDAQTETRSVVVEKVMPHPPEKVWRAITTPALMEDWLMKNDFEPRVGHEFTFRHDPTPQWDGVVIGRVIEVEPPERLAYTWGSLGLESVVTWTLTPTPSGTHVRMEHAGFRPDQEHAYRGATAGWSRFVDNLARVLDTA